MENKSEQVPTAVSPAAPQVRWMRDAKRYIPPVDVYETADNIILVADVPGADEKSIDITVEKNVLTIQGTVEPVAFKDHKLSYLEYDVGDYYRSFTLSGEIDREKIAAVVRDGVLHLTLPKSEQMKTKKIAVKSA